MKKLIFLSFFIGSFLFSKTAYFYKDIAIVNENFSNISAILIPEKAMDINFSKPDINIISKIQTNIYKESISNYLEEYERITNEIEKLKNEKRDKERELEIINKKVELFEKLIINLPANPSSKGIDSLIDKYYTSFENELKKKNKVLPLIEGLEKKIREKEIRTKELENIMNENQVLYYLYTFEKPSSGELKYKLNIKWNIQYILNRDDNKLDMNVAFNAGRNFELPLDSLMIINYNYSAQNMERLLKPSKSYLSEKNVYRSGASKVKAFKLMQELDSAPESENIEVSGSETGFIFEVNKKVKLTERLVQPLFTSLPVSTSGSYFAIPLKSSWGYYALTISNTTQIPFVPGEMFINLKKEIIPVKITNTILQNSSYELSGIEVKEVEVLRTKIEDFNDTPDLLRNTIINKKTIEIKIKNRLGKNIEILILDRIPLPSEDRIRLKDVKITGKNNNEIKNILSQNGIIEWKLSLKPAEEKKIYISYKTEYPANYNIYEVEE